MSFWEQLRQQVRERTTAGDITYELYERIAATGVAEIALIQPTFQLGQFSVLSHDYMDMTEKLLSVPAGDVGRGLRAILYLRETARAMARLVRHSSDPIESLMQYLDEIYSSGLEEEDEEVEEEVHVHDEHCGHEHAEEEDELAEDRDRLCEDLRVKLREIRLGDGVVKELSSRIADVYHECVRFQRDLKELSETEPTDLEGFLPVMADLQFVLDFHLRRLLLEDVFLEEKPTFTTGLMPWISHAVEELARHVAESQAPVATPA